MTRSKRREKQIRSTRALIYKSRQLNNSQQMIRSLISYRIQIRIDPLSAKLVPSNSTQFVSVWTNSNRWYLNQIRDLPSEAMIGSSVNSSSSSFLGVIPVRCWLLMVKVSWICYGGWRFCEDDWRLVQWMWLKNRGGRGGWSGGLALPCGASNDEAPTTMEDERVLKVRIKCGSFLESGENRSNLMIGNDCLLYRLDPRGKLENWIWVVRSWFLPAGFKWRWVLN